MLKNKYQDWQPYIGKIFELTKVQTLLEFGLGGGTEYFLNKCKHVTSIEIGVSKRHKQWYEKCKEEYKSYTNWEAIYIEGSTRFIDADRLAHERIHGYSEHMPELRELIQSLDRQDMIFVDAGIHNRGDIINLLFELDKADIIAAHDTSRFAKRCVDIYGYNRLVIPKNFAEFHFEGGTVGTTIWVKENKLL